MSFRKKASLIIYRFRERGLEVFMINDPIENDRWDIPQGDMETPRNDRNEFIELDPVAGATGEHEEAYAVEGDWHEIPSLKSMLYEDAMQLKEKLKEIENGTFVNVKEALKKALPHQYAFIKELKDILRDRNSLRDL